MSPTIEQCLLTIVYNVKYKYALQRIHVRNITNINDLIESIRKYLSVTNVDTMRFISLLE